jgi:hypothetical protein
MTHPRRTPADRERRRDLLLAATGLHPVSAAVDTALRAPGLKLPRRFRTRREGLIT